MTTTKTTAARIENPYFVRVELYSPIDGWDVDETRTVVKAFDTKQEAWEYVKKMDEQYNRELTEQEIDQYELVSAEPKLYFGYVRYADGSTMCHAKGTLAEVKASEERIKATSKVRVRGFKRNEVSREFFEAHV